MAKNLTQFDIHILNKEKMIMIFTDDNNNILIRDVD
jgi:hypothetical protein